MKADALKDLCINSLEDIKAENITCIDVRNLTGVTDYMVIATGTSDRHIKALANNVIVDCKEADVMPLGVEGEDSRDWVLVDLGDVVVHVMTAETREFYALEKLWQPAGAKQQGE